jgi:hypothetical protein
MQTVISRESGSHLQERLPNINLGARIPKSVVASALFVVFLLMSFIVPPHCTQTGYFTANRQKHSLLENTPSPKVVFVGGSNLAFGLDSAALEQNLRLPVINMGLCDMFGIRYVLGEVVDSINQGDLVVMVPEYYMLEFGADGTSELFRSVEAYPPSALWILKSYCHSPASLGKLLMIFHSYVIAKWRSLVDSCLDVFHGDLSFRSLTRPCEPKWSFNKQGDFLGHLSAPARSRITYPLSCGQANPESLSFINRFSRQLDERGAKLVLLPCPIPENSYGSAAAHNIAREFQQLRTTCSAALPSEPQRYVFATEDFYETPYHLNATGRKRRTQLVAEDLRKFLVPSAVAAVGDSKNN